VVGSLAASALLLAVFFILERLQAEPMLDLHYFKNPRFTAATTSISLVFFAMFGSYFLFTQYLQFVHGYDPLSAGVRILPWALAYLVSATQSAKLVERFGQRAVVASGLTIAGFGIALLAVTSGVTASYWWFAIAVVIQALGMGITTAPSTGAIMRSLPLHKAGVGSAVNDTTRELGGALGVAIVGSIMSSLYAAQLAAGVPDGVPAPVLAAARESLGAAIQAGTAVADPARDAFVHAMSWASALVALVAALGALIAWRYLPARVNAPASAPPQRDARGLAASTARSAHPASAAATAPASAPRRGR